MKLVSAVVAALVLALLGGCSSFQRMSAPDRVAIQRVYVDPAVKLPEDMFYWDRSSSMAVGIGAGLGVVAGSGGSAGQQGAAIGIGTGLGMAAGQMLAQGPKGRMLLVMRDNGISVGDIVREQAIAHLKGQDRMDVVDTPEDADATARLDVRLYGFNQTQGFSPLLYPMLTVEMALVDKTGRRVWRKADYIVPLSKRNTDGFRFDEYVAEPQKIRRVFGIAATALMDDIVATIPARAPRAQASVAPAGAPVPAGQ